MAVGAGEQYWDGQNLPSKLKHEILRRYLPIYLARTSSKSQVVVLDAYAGRGVYDDGTPGSAGLMLNWALQKKSSSGAADYILRFFERDKKSYDTLSEIVGKAAAQGIDVVAKCADVIPHVGTIVKAAEGMPLFLFIDPTGVGLPFEALVSAMTRPRTGTWPPTEALINFSWQAIRRIGGHVSSPNRNENTLATLDRALGGPWWQQYFTEGVTDEAVHQTVEGFEARLAESTQAVVLSVPVRRDFAHKPLYSLMFVTRNARGAWNFGDATAKSLADWRKAVDAQNDRLDLSPTRQDLEKQALPSIETNIMELVTKKKTAITVGDYPLAVFGFHYGEIGETVVRAAIKSLHDKGLTPSNGVGGKIEDLVVAPA